MTAHQVWPGMFLISAGLWLVCGSHPVVRGADFTVWLMSEKWQGLGGRVLVESDMVRLGPRLWELVRYESADSRHQPADGQRRSEAGADSDLDPQGVIRGERAEGPPQAGGPWRDENPDPPWPLRELERAGLNRLTVVPVFPHPGIRHQGLPRDAPWQSRPIPGSVGLRIRGESVKFQASPRASRVIPGEQAGKWLTYAVERDGKGQLETRLSLRDRRPERSPEGSSTNHKGQQLPRPAESVSGGGGPSPAAPRVEDVGESCEWRLVESSRSIGGRGDRVGEFQFEVRHKVRFALEAVRRPGWYLAVIHGDLRLTRDATQRQMLEVEQWLFYDDLDDGR